MVNKKSGHRLGQRSALERVLTKAGRPEEADTLRFLFTFPVYNLMRMMMCTAMMHTACLPKAADAFVPMPEGTLLE